MSHVHQQLTTTEHALIDAHAELVKAEIRAMAQAAMKEIRRKAAFPNRSAGQRKRRGQG